MLEKKRTVNCLNGLFKKIQVTYWDGTVKEYGQGSGIRFLKLYSMKNSCEGFTE